MPRKHSINISITIEDQDSLIEQARAANCFKGKMPCLSKYLAKIAQDDTIAELREEIISLQCKIYAVKEVLN